MEVAGMDTGLVHALMKEMKIRLSSFVFYMIPRGSRKKKYRRTALSLGS